MTNTTIQKNKYTIYDVLAGLVVVGVALGFLILLPHYMHPLVRFGIGAVFGTAILFVYIFLVRKPDDVIEAEMNLYSAIEKAEIVSLGLRKSSMTRVSEKLSEGVSLIALIATTILKEGVLGYKSEIRHVLRTAKALATFVEEDEPDKAGINDALETLRAIHESVTRASDQRVAEAKADMDLIRDLYRTNKSAAAAIATLSKLLDESPESK